MDKIFADVDEALDLIRAGQILIVVDDEDRENEGDFIMAAELVSPQAVNLMVSRGRGLVCQAITRDRARELELPPMAAENTSSHTTAFTVSVDLRDRTTTGISAFDRAATIRALTDLDTRPEDLLRPGHIFPLVAQDGGVLARRGHTEAAVDLPRLAGLRPSGVLCEILDEDGKMARLPRLMEIAEELQLKILTIESLAQYRAEKEQALDQPAIRRLSETPLPTDQGDFQVVLYQNPRSPEQPHLALISRTRFDPDAALVRIHSECLTGEVLGSRKCDCGPQLRRGMHRIAREGGVLVYLRQEGRGIGLTEKIRAYALQEQGLDTVAANLELGHASDERDFSIAAAILTDLGVRGARLLTNNPDKIDALRTGGIQVRQRVPLEIPPSRENRNYLSAKKMLMGHLLEEV